jgi:ATP-binding cassette, subfamily B, bacterial NisT/SpaT
VNSTQQSIDFKNILLAFKYWPKLFNLFWKVSKVKFFIITILSLVQGIIPIVSLYFTQLLVNTLLTVEKGYFKEIIFIFTLFVIFLICKELVNLLHSYVDGLFQTLLSNKLNIMILNKSITLGQEDFENPEIQDQLKRAQQETSFRPYQIFQQILSIVTSIVILISSIGFLIYWNWWVASISILLPFVSFISLLKISNSEFLIHWNRAEKNRQSWYLTHLITHDKAFKEVKLNNIGGFLTNKFKDILEGFYQEDKKIAYRRLNITLLFSMINVSFIGFSIYLLMKATYLKEILVGSFISYVQAIMLMQTTSQTLVQSIINLCQHNLFIEQLFSYLNTKSTDPSFSKKDNTIHLQNIESIEFQNVSFAYPATDFYALKNVSFKLKKGEVAAIVGKNGSGKSTLIKILSQLYTNYDGTILINNKDIKTYDTESLRKNIGVVFQDFTQYEMSTRYNIGFGDIDNMNKDDLIHAAVEKAKIQHLINQLPNGLDTQLGRWFPGGVQLSGGQWQRIAIARAFFKDADLYILDEPSAALDPYSEKEVFEGFMQLIENKVGIFISHRYTSTVFAKKIIYMEEGSIKALGSHEELMRTCREYSNLYNMQASTYNKNIAVNQ